MVSTARHAHPHEVAPCAQLQGSTKAARPRMSNAERRTFVVLMLTAITMVGEIAAGSVFGSLALLADGWHMGSHAAALGIALFAYAYARRHADDPRYSFGTGKVNALGGFASSMLLACVAVAMLYEAAQRFMTPVEIRYNDAIVVAIIGLLVNGASVFLLKDQAIGHDHGSAHAHNHGHSHDAGHVHDTGHGADTPTHDVVHHRHGSHDQHADTPTHDVVHHRHGSHDQHADHAHHDHHRDTNMRGAYLHVLADALTSLLAIGALFVAKYTHVSYIDPAVGVVGALIILKWGYGLIQTTSRELLDADVTPAMLDKVRRCLEKVPDTEVVDLHVWRLGPQHHAAIVSIVSDNPPEVYKRQLADETSLAHVTVEVNPTSK